MKPQRSPALVCLLAGALAAACRGEPRGPCEPTPPPGEIGSICGFENPEDVAWVPAASLLLVSQMRHAGEGPGGSLAALALDPSGEPIAPPRRLWPPAREAVESQASAHAPAGDPECTQPPQAARFAPHGLAAGAPEPDGALPIAVVAHGEREAVELFALRGVGEAAALRWTGCVPLPANVVGDDVWLGADGEIWVTNYQPALTGLRGLYYTIVGGLGLPTGEVLRWRPGGAPASLAHASGAPARLGHAGSDAAHGWEAIPDTRGPNPNGLVLAPGGATLGVAFTSARAVAIRPLAPGGDAARDIGVGGYPDALLWSSRATLLVPVHTNGFAVLRCRFGALPCTSPWKLMEIDPARGLASEIFAHDGSRIGAVSSVAEVGKRLYFGSVFDDRIGLWIER